jgi:squalene-hopene/tetraprenyl-beta-curcumene cyclase
MRMSTPFLALGLVAVACSSPSSAAESKAAEARAAKSLVCEGVAVREKAHPGNPDARKAAQHGLGYLTGAAQAWTAQHGCFGCHVQAVTMEALTVGQHHHYDVGAKDLAAMVAALKMGVTAGGRTTGTAFEGQAWARYDAWIDGQHTADLLKYAADLLALQNQDGSVPDDDARLPVTGGTMHTTYQAMQTWRQAYARTADDKWITPMRKAERYLAGQSSDWGPRSDVYLQNVNFALLGLVAAGVGPGEASSLRLQRILLARQNQDGGWGLDPKTSDALATGQSLYALRLAGHGDGEGAIDRGTAWLVSHQGRDGAWRTVRSGQGGAEKGEGMWAVLGLVAMDVTSVAVTGLVDGQHVVPSMRIGVEARDNQAGGVAKIELVLDDRPLGGACAATLSYDWSTAGLSEGKHTLDVVATNTKGQVSRRRFEVYAGNVLLTELGTRYDEARQTTEIGVRNLAPTREAAGRVELSVYTADGSDNRRGRKVYGGEQPGVPGAMTFLWDGTGEGGKAQPRGRYIAELTLRDAKGQVIQRSETLFLQDAEAVQKQKYGEIEGQLSIEGGAGVSANTVLELVDDKGKVVQRVRSTEQGNYRFKNVAEGTYKVRTRKDGFADEEASVHAAPASAPAKADMKLH